jgi:hypothetical protein
MARYENTSPERVELIFFYESELGQLIYSWRSKSVEPLRADKDVFGIDPLPVRGGAQGEDVRPSIGPAIRRWCTTAI